MAWIKLGRTWRNLDHLAEVSFQHEELATVVPVSGASFRVVGPDAGLLAAALDAQQKRPAGRPRKVRDTSDVGDDADAEVEGVPLRESGA